MKRAVFTCVLLAILTPAIAATADDSEIRQLLNNRITTARKANSITVGILDEKGRRIISAGQISDTNAKVPDGDTIYEIRSITKVFTAILLADMVIKGEVKLDDPVSKYVPDSVKMPAYESRAITLLDLTTQTSALPRMPSNFHPADAENPYADYTVEQMYEFLGGYKLTRAPGEKYDYSNLGVGLLGHALARRASMSYEALVTERILKPLGMTRSTITFKPMHMANLATAHDANLKPNKNWDLPTFAGAGALRSSANDMLKFLAANLGLTDTPLRKAMELTHQIRKQTLTPDLAIAMGWHVFNKYNTAVVWHNGGTGGYRTWAGFVEANKTAVVLLCNTSFSVDDLGLHFLVSNYPAKQLPSPPKEITVDRAILKKLVGKYPLTPAFAITITEEDGKLFAQATNQPKLQLFAESESRFFLKEVEAAVTFDKNEQGEATGLTLHQGGLNQKAKRDSN